MSLFSVQKFVFSLKQNDSLQVKFKEGDLAVFEGFALDEAEREVLRNGDIVSLFRMGVHPLLLAPFARFAEITPVQYKARLAPERGSRKLRS